jgi:hypothetical protein
MPHKKNLTTTSLSGSVQLIERRIYLIRGQKVMLDFDLAELYGAAEFATACEQAASFFVRRDLTRPSSSGPTRAEVYFHDWRQVDGVKIPFRLTQVMATRKFVTTIEEVKHNIPVDDAIFRKP